MLTLKSNKSRDENYAYLETRIFNSTDISVTNSSCDTEACVITVRPERGTAKYTCEVSSEGPRFAVDKRSANMTLAVMPEYDPLITGLPTLVQVGEQALVNCTSDYSLPAATIDWFVDSEPQEVRTKWSIVVHGT
ncbi:hypothetical protein PYW08_016823 [Mythimna loreyi]|uniref:Uncharacterized protein n=1 Tax=Mythimna loreyi TaxID=667449 RepID=A0ACC2R0U3_9NEOP|nr:hypothetical protein PYW08_016823 [Mythimna loreyi]